MLNKRRLHHQSTKIRPVRAWPFLAAALVFLAVGIYGLRQNNFEMIRLRQAVVEADKNNGNVEQALSELREHVHSHMNTNLSSGNFAIKPPIQLKYRYERLAKAEQDKVAGDNEKIQAKAERLCAGRHPGAGFNSPRVACIAEYVRVNAVKPSDVAADLYKFDFISPRWSPDIAGFGLLLSVIFFLIFLLRISAGWWYRHLL